MNGTKGTAEKEVCKFNETVLVFTLEEPCVVLLLQGEDFGEDLNEGFLSLKCRMIDI